MSIKKRSLFKVIDPTVRKDVYSSLVVLWIVWMVSQTFFLLYYSLSSNYGETSTGADFYLILAFILFSCLVFLTCILIIAHILNRLTGPIYRMTTDLEAALKEGKKPHIKLRKGDYFQNLADAINQLAEKDK